MVLYLIDGLAALFLAIGCCLAFRPNAVRAWAERLRPSHESPVEPGVAARDPEGVAAVLRMVGIMLIAFSFTGAAFANMIAYYTRAGVS